MSLNSVRSRASFLSPYVRHLLVDLVRESKISDDVYKKCFTTSFTLNWEQIECLIGKPLDDFNIHDQSQTWFTSAVKAVLPIFHESLELLKGVEDHVRRNLWDLCSWTKKENEIEAQFGLFINGGPVECVETVLFLTSILERSLGNVFLIQGQSVPLLLRDLLSTKELKSILGIVPITFMQLLFGTPLALNLRNVVWHGFPGPDEIHPCFGSILFVVTGSIGELLKKIGVKNDSIPKRLQVTDFGSYISLLDKSLPDVSNHIEEAKQIFHCSVCIADSHKIFLDTALDLYKKGRYGKSVMLLFPQMEHVLRNIFCLVNDCSERFLTAESNTLYTTFDEILNEKVEEQTANKIRTVLGDHILEMLDDILTHLSGPRIRDRLSHGECDLSAIPYELCNHIVAVSLAILCRVKHLELKYDNSQKDSSNNNDICIDVFLENEINNSVRRYVSKFHNGQLVKRAVVDCIAKIERWKTVEYPYTDEFNTKLWDNTTCTQESVLELKKKLKMIIPCSCLSEETNCYSESLYRFIEKIDIKTIYRPKREGEVLILLKQIMANVSVLVVQVCDGLSVKYVQYSRHELRSRQRQTYKRMLNSVPVLYEGVLCVISLVAVQLSRLDSLSLLNDTIYKTCQRFLKSVIQYVENLKSYTQVDRNRWDEALALTVNFCHRADHSITELYM